MNRYSNPEKSLSQSLHSGAKKGLAEKRDLGTQWLKKNRKEG
jgi:hypothetical protein